MKKIYIDISFIYNNKTGIGQYVENLILALKDNVNLEYFDLKLPQKLKFKSIFWILWLNSYIYIKTLIKRPKAIFFPAFFMPYFKVKNVKYYTVIHDLCHLREGEMTKYFKFIYNLSTNISIKRADIIVTVSETIKQELIEAFNISPNKIKVTYNSIGQHFINPAIDNNILQKYDIDKDKYILSVATLNKRKNIPDLIKAFEKISSKYPNLKLVLVGGMGNEQREKLTQHKNVIFTGYIADEELPTLYKNAMFYVFPSLYEGFGIPLIEAQEMSCPVLCSDIPVFREVAGESAEFTTTESDGIVEKFEYLINNPERREELIKLGSENVKRFSTDKILEQLKEII